MRLTVANFLVFLAFPCDLHCQRVSRGVGTDFRLAILVRGLFSPIQFWILQETGK